LQAPLLAGQARFVANNFGIEVGHVAIEAIAVRTTEIGDGISGPLGGEGEAHEAAFGEDRGAHYRSGLAAFFHVGKLYFGCPMMVQNHGFVRPVAVFVLF
jgi:hypothetical protein